MKFNYSLIAGAVALACSAGAAQASVTLLSDGFEAAGSPTNPPWQSFSSNAGGIVQSSVDPYAGSYSLELNNTSLGAADFVKAQQIGSGVVNTGDSITIAGEVRGSLGVSGDVQVVAFGEACAPPGGCGTNGSTFVKSLAGTLNANSTVWSPFSYTFTINGTPVGGLTVQLSAVTGAVSGAFAHGFFDNVTITDTTASAVPVPASIWLLGSALVGGLGVFRRKTIKA